MKEVRSPWIVFREPQEPDALISERCGGPYRNELRALWVDWPETRHFVEALALHFSDSLVLVAECQSKQNRGTRKRGCDTIFDVLLLAGLAAFDEAHSSGDRARLRAFIGAILQKAQDLLASLEVRAGSSSWTVQDKEPLTAFLKRAARPIEVVRLETYTMSANETVLAHLVNDRLKAAIAR